MASKLLRNTIITGQIDSFCLVCERHFDSEEAANSHIDDEEHEQRLLQHPYLDKYQGDHIRKVNKRYFCEFCSVTLTGTGVDLHIDQKSHFINKQHCLLKRVGPVITAFDDIVINEKAWHSFTDDTCAICSTTFENESHHKTESEHLLKLLLHYVEFGENNRAYRKIDVSSFQCLTCNTVCALESFEEHFDDADQKKLYAQCQEEMKMHREQNKLTNTSSTRKQNGSREKRPENEISDTTQVPSKVDEINVETNLAVAILKPNETKATESKESKNYQSKKPTTAKKFEDTHTHDETTAYAKKNNLTYNSGNAYCRFCEANMPSTLSSLKEHVTGKKHKVAMAKAAQTAAQQAKHNITRRSMEKFVENCVVIVNPLYQDAVINGIICVPFLSFVMITKTGGRYRCQSCEVNLFDMSGIDNHRNSKTHMRAMKDTSVITSLRQEFVREVRPQIYHCGFCNMVIGPWSSVAAHSQSREHAARRGECRRRLQRHLPALGDHRGTQLFDLFKMFEMLHYLARH